MSTHTTTYHGRYLDLEVYSSALDSTFTNDVDPIPTFRPKDRVAGQVILHPIASTAGRLSIHVLGILTFTPTTWQSSTPTPEILSHTFFNHSITTTLPPSPNRLSAFARRPSLSAGQFFPFDFPLRASGNLPCTFSSSSLTTLAPRNRTFVDSLSISYKVVATWEPEHTSSSTRFSAFLHPEQIKEEEVGETIEALFALEGAGDEISDQPQPYKWRETPLITDRPLAFSCATTLPTPTTFSRTSPDPSIPFFVVFTTTSHDPAMIREIASDATIAISLIRIISFTHPELESGSTSRRSSRAVSATQIPPPSPPTPTSMRSFNYSTISHPRLHHTGTNAKTHRRSAKYSPINGAESPRMGGQRVSLGLPANATLPTPPPSPARSQNQIHPQEEYTESRTLSTSFSAGFTKRPKHGAGGREGKPEGLFKGSLTLSENWVPSLECAGLGVKYFVDVSVLVGQDEFRARIPVKIV